MLAGEVGGSHKEEVFCILCWLMVASTQSFLVKVHYVSEFCSILRGGG